MCFVRFESASLNSRQLMMVESLIQSEKDFGLGRCFTDYFTIESDSLLLSCQSLNWFYSGIKNSVVLLIAL